MNMENQIKNVSKIENQINKYFSNVATNFAVLQTRTPVIIQIALAWIDCLTKGNKVIFCGNGGSAADSQHLAAELMGRYKIDRKPMPALSLTTDTSALTAIGNDYGYEHVFSRPLRGIGNQGDVLVGISTSGNSKNVINAFDVAKGKGIITVAFTGNKGGTMKQMADYALNVPSDETNHIQEMHIACGHLICGLVENYFFGNTK